MCNMFKVLVIIFIKQCYILVFSWQDLLQDKTSWSEWNLQNLLVALDSGSCTLHIILLIEIHQIWFPLAQKSWTAGPLGCRILMFRSWFLSKQNWQCLNTIHFHTGKHKVSKVLYLQFPGHLNTSWQPLLF